MTSAPAWSSVMLAVIAWAEAGACTVNATGHHFGTIDPLVDSPTDTTSTIAVTCPTPTSYTIALGSGAGSYAVRSMQGGLESLSYNLYSDAARTRIWGDGTSATEVVPGMAGATGMVHTVYGRVAHQPAAVPGVYSDSIIVTVSF